MPIPRDLELAPLGLSQFQSAMLPIVLSHLIGISELALPLRVVEQTLLFADVCLFAVVFLSAVAVFAAETIGAAKRRIDAALSENRHE